MQTQTTGRHGKAQVKSPGFVSVSDILFLALVWELDLAAVLVAHGPLSVAFPIAALGREKSLLDQGDGRNAQILAFSLYSIPPILPFECLQSKTCSSSTSYKVLNDKTQL